VLVGVERAEQAPQLTFGFLEGPFNGRRSRATFTRGGIAAEAVAQLP